MGETASVGAFVSVFLGECPTISWEIHWMELNSHRSGLWLEPNPNMSSIRVAKGDGRRRPPPRCGE